MDLAGAFVPSFTPFDEEGRLELGAVPGHVDRLLAGGVTGILAAGTTGEFADLTGPEHAKVVAAAVAAAAARVPVLAGVGAVGTTEACAHARGAAEAGADGLLCLPPLYWKLDEDGLVRHFTAVAEATSLPLLLYDFPSLAGTALTPPLVERLAAEVPSVVGIKQSGPELRTVHTVLQRVKRHRPEFAVMVGQADLALPALLAGADGVIAAIGNVAPVAVARLVEAVRAGELEAARGWHERIRWLLTITTGVTPPVLALKAAAHAAGSPVRPVVRTTPEDAEGVRARAAALAGDLLAADLAVDHE